MHILLDECMPELLKGDIRGHQVATVGEIGWVGAKNGRLLTLAESAGFDVLLTVDRNIEHQQNMKGRKISLVVMDAPSKLTPLRALVPMLLQALKKVQPGTVVHVDL